jgi:hypothetical protein
MGQAQVLAMELDTHAGYKRLLRVAFPDCLTVYVHTTYVWAHMLHHHCLVNHMHMCVADLSRPIPRYPLIHPSTHPSIHPSIHHTIHHNQLKPMQLDSLQSIHCRAHAGARIAW